MKQYSTKTENRIEIPLGKSKIIWLFLGAFTFVALGMVLLIKPQIFGGAVEISTIYCRVIGAPAVLFFGACGAYSMKKLFDNKLGLVIDAQGIYDNSNAASIGLVKWVDIIDVRTHEISSSKFLLIYVSNPDYYIAKANGFKRKLMKANNNSYGTPVTITCNTLKCKFEVVQKLLKDNLQKRQGNRLRALNVFKVTSSI